ncbi:MAG: hypothetical protein ACRCX2_08110 [Paraclostridium sp.]
MARFNIRMEKLIKDNSDEYSITRGIDGGLTPDGEWVEGTLEIIKMNLMITTAKKEDYDELNIGNTTKQVVKIRQIKSEPIHIQQDDKFTFNGLNFKVIKDKLYQSHFADFIVKYATTEADANG